jgi:superoxide dismutase, Cu-Zn family
MKKIKQISLLALLALFLLLPILSQVSAQSTKAPKHTAISLSAIAVVKGENIQGTVRLIQFQDGFLPTVSIHANIHGLVPNSEHGMHLHETALCETPSFKSAGGHFDPGPYGNPDPDTNHPYHLGDLPPLKVNSEGIGVLNHTTSRVSLSAGLVSLFDNDGTAIIIHANPDQGISGESGSGVGGGARIACGVIKLTND